jgi:GLPGLI family protein
MKKLTIKPHPILFIFVIFNIANIQAQIADSFTIHYTKTTTIHKALGDNPYAESIKKMVPKYQKNEFVMVCKNGISHYSYIPPKENTSAIPAWMMMGSGGNEIVRNKDSFQMRKEMMDLKMLVQDSVIPLTWKITADKRNIAGYECRKAIAKFQDTILIYAFYSEELAVSGGPEVVGGLPGAILGMGIPKYNNTTWFADKVEMHAKGFSPVLTPVKKEKIYTMQSLKSEIKMLFDNRWTKDTEKVFWGLFF